MTPDRSMFEPRLTARRRAGFVFAALCLLLAVTAMGLLFVLLGQVFYRGVPWLSEHFLTRNPSVLSPKEGGMHSAIIGSLWLIGLTTLFAVPVGVGAALWLEEYAPRNRLTGLIRLNIANLAGVPSIVYGILGLAIFVRWAHFDHSVLSGALTLSLLILPVIIIASREAIAAVPDSTRHAAFALGATRWQTVWHHVLPAALPGIMTGVILSLSRAIGETAPLIMVGAAVLVLFTPGGGLPESVTPGGLWEWLGTALSDPFTAMPIQVFHWAGQPDEDFHDLAAAGIVVMLTVLLTMNSIAIGIRAWQQSRRS